MLAYTERAPFPKGGAPPEGQDMHPYHIKEYTDERVATRLRSARRHELLAEARASQEPGPSGPRRGARFRIPLLNWELSMQRARHARAGC